MKHGDSTIHRCKDCMETFSVKTQLNHHIVSHHSTATIPCLNEDCNLLFKNSATQQVHYVRHHMDHKTLFQIDRYKQFVCLQCHKQFKKAAIYYHVSTCSAKSPFLKGTSDLQRLVDMDDEDETSLILCQLSNL